MNLIHYITHRHYIKNTMFEKINYIFNPIIKISKLFKILNSVEDVKVSEQGDLYIKMKRNLLISVPGSTVMINKNDFILGYSKGALSPDFNIEELVNIEDINGSILTIVRKNQEVEFNKYQKYLNEQGIMPMEK